MSAINERVSPKKPLFAEVHNVPDDYRFTTEELDRIISGDMFTPRQDAIMARELQQYRAAAEPVVSDSMALAFHAAITDSAAGADDIEEIKTGLRAALANYAAPQVTSVPETLPCPVVLEPGLRFGKGVRTQAVLDALQRRATYYAELEAMTPEQRAEHNAGIKEFAAMLAAPAVQAESILQDFYSAYDEWINSGAPEGAPFSRCVGLCASLFDYISSTVLEGLHAEFVAAGFDEKLPFNASEAEFEAESGRDECHTNPARVAWVRARIADAAQPAVQAEQPVSQPTLPEHSPCVDAPDHIWLQTAGDWPASGEFSELTWSCDNQHPDDTLYVRADLVGNSPVIPDSWLAEAERLAELHGASFVLFRHGQEPICADPSKFWFGYDPAAPEQGTQEVKK